MSRTLLIIFSLLFAAVAIGAVYKWIDDEGNVHYGDTPPKGQEKESIDIAPTPPPKTITDAQGREKQPKAEKEVLRDGETEGDPDDGNKGAEQPISRFATDIKCFTPVTKSWGGRISDTREGVTRQPFKNDERDQLMTLFDALEGSWRGRVEDITCRGTDAEPSVKTHHYESDLTARWESKQIYRIEAELGGSATRANIRQFFWFLPGMDGLRFRRTTNDTPFELDIPGNDAEILEVGDNRVTFYWRRGGALRQTNVFSIKIVGRSFTISEFFYMKGVLDGKRLWTLGK